jgi:hypothetical protein
MLECHKKLLMKCDFGNRNKEKMRETSYTFYGL